MESTLLLYFYNVNRKDPSPPLPLNGGIVLAPLWNICKYLGISTKKVLVQKYFHLLSHNQRYELNIITSPLPQ